MYFHPHKVLRSCLLGISGCPQFVGEQLQPTYQTNSKPSHLHFVISGKPNRHSVEATFKRFCLRAHVLCNRNNENFFVNFLLILFQMRSFLLTDPPLPGAYKPRRGEFCVAQFSEDNMWYRARVEKMEGERAHVHYIDFGNVSCVLSRSSYICFCELRHDDLISG